MFTFNPAPKPEHKRQSKTAKSRGSIPPSVRKQVEIRSKDHCERCGKHKSHVWTLENAHIKRRWKSEVSITESDIVRLCGPSTDSTTCHHFADYTRLGREWLEQFQSMLREKEVG